jgi:acyl dehydratase
MRIAACEPKDATWGRVVVECNVINQKGQLVLVNHQVILAGRRPPA